MRESRVTVLKDNPTAEEFDALVASKDAVVVDFYATWCGPCKSYSPKFQRVAREIRRDAPEGPYAFVTVDIDDSPDLAGRFGVKSVPTTIVVRRKRTFFLGERAVEAARFSGDKPWPELVRYMRKAVLGKE